MRSSQQDTQDGYIAVDILADRQPKLILDKKSPPHFFNSLLSCETYLLLMTKNQFKTVIHSLYVRFFF